MRLHNLPPPIVMMGVPFDQVSSSQTILLIEDMVASGRSHQLATANVDFLTLASGDRHLHRILTQADLVVCDGTPLVWMSRLLGAALPERVAGSELVPLLLDLATSKKYRVFFLGGREDVLNAAEVNMRKQWPDLAIAGMYSPPFAPLDQMDHDDICARIRDAKPDMLFVAFGCPKQEKWLSMNLTKTGVPVGIGVGATIDFLAGNVKQAPKWMRRSGTEWIWRILQEPRRLAGRYAHDIAVVGPGLLRQLWKMRGRGFFLQQSPQTEPDSEENLSAEITAGAEQDGVIEVSLPKRFDAQFVSTTSFSDKFEHSSARWLLVKADGTEFIDSTATGKILRLSRIASKRGGKLLLVNSSPNLLSTLELMNLRSLFGEVASLEEGHAQAARPVRETTAPQFWPEEVSAATMSSLSDDIFRLMNSCGAKRDLTIELSKVRFIDSAGVGFMLRVRREAQRAGYSLAFTAPSQDVRSILENLGLHDYLLGSAS